MLAISGLGAPLTVPKPQAYGPACGVGRERISGLFAAWAALVVVAALLFVARPAQAQRAFYLDRVQFGGAPEDGLVTRRPYIAPETRVYGSMALAYVLNPLRASTVAVDQQIEERIENL